MFASFGETLKRLRKQQKMSQQHLAKKVGVHSNTMSGWERGNNLPESKGIVLELAHQLHLDERETRQLLEASLTALSPYWQVPYPRNPFFTGREKVLHQLHETLTHERTVTLSQSYALSGLGGIGKTQTAIEYAYRFANEYAGVFWISAETAETIISSIVALAILLSLPEKQEPDQEKVVAAVLAWLTNHRDWLLIFDNVEDPLLLKKFLPPARRGSLLFTSRRQTLGLITQTFGLETMTREEGMNFLLRRARLLDPFTSLDTFAQTDVAFAQEIVAAMDGLPLALDQAGAYIEATRCSLSDYLHLFRSSPLRLLNERDAHADHPLPVAKTFALIFEQIEHSNALATDLLTVCAFLAPEAIPEMFFTKGATYLEARFETLASDPFLFQNVLKTLLTSSLLQRNTSSQAITIHRLVQAVLRESLPANVQCTWVRRILQTMTHLFPANENIQSDYWQIGEPLLPHALACITLGERWQKNDPLRLTLMNHVAVYLSNRLRFREAESLFRQVLSIGEHVPDSEHFLIAEVLCGLGLLSLRQKKHEEALALFQRAFERIPGAAEHPLRARVLHELGTLYDVQGKYHEAKQCYEQALQIREQTLGCEHPLVATSLNNLAVLYSQEGKYHEAKQCYERALRIREHTLGCEHPLTAALLNNLADLYTLQEEYTQAEPLFQHALHIWEQVLGSEHIRLSYPLTGLADLYTRQGRYEKAEPLFLRALQIIEQRRGLEHFQIAEVLDGLADLYRRQGKYAEATSLYQRALRIIQQQFGPEHPLLARSLTGFAVLLTEQRFYEQAEAFYQQALTIRLQHLNPQHPDIAETLFHFASFYQLQQHTTEALSLYQQALAIREQTQGSHHPKTCVTRTAYTHLLQAVEHRGQGATTKNPARERTLLCKCGCGQQIATNKSRGEPKQFFSGACKQRFYRNATHAKRNGETESVMRSNA